MSGRFYAARFWGQYAVYDQRYLPCPVIEKHDSEEEAKAAAERLNSNPPRERAKK